MPTKKSGKEVPGKKGKKTIARNRTARHDYEITETFEAGLVLTGTEVKSLRERACQITDSFCIVRGGELWWVGAHIHPYSNGGVWNVDPDRRGTYGRNCTLQVSIGALCGVRRHGG